MEKKWTNPLEIAQGVLTLQKWSGLILKGSMFTYGPSNRLDQELGEQISKDYDGKALRAAPAVGNIEEERPWLGWTDADGLGSATFRRFGPVLSSVLDVLGSSLMYQQRSACSDQIFDVFDGFLACFPPDERGSSLLTLSVFPNTSNRYRTVDRLFNARLPSLDSCRVVVFVAEGLGFMVEYLS